MAYQSQAQDYTCSGYSHWSGDLRQPGLSSCHSSNDLLYSTNNKNLNSNSKESLFYSHHDNRHSYPQSQRGHHRPEYRLEDFSYDIQCCRAEPLISDSHINRAHTDYLLHKSEPQPEFDQGSNMSSNITCNIPSKSKYSFGLYFQPKSSGAVTSSSSSNGSCSISTENLDKGGPENTMEQPWISKSQTYEFNQRPPGSNYRKTSLEEISALSSSAKSKEFFIRYSSDKAASDIRQRYYPRHSSYERYSLENRPSYVITRSQTASTLSPSTGSTSTGHSPRQSSNYMKTSPEHSSDSTWSRQYIPVYSGNRQQRSAESANKRLEVGGGSGQSAHYSEQSNPSTGSRTFVLRIPCEQQMRQLPKVTESSCMPMRQKYGTTVALTRSPTATHIEIQKSIGKPLVSQRKYQFESGKHENTPPPGNGGPNRYKTEIEKITTQPKFSSVALRKASFEQSPDRDPPGYDSPVEIVEQPPTGYPAQLTETAQPTVKVKKISTEIYDSGSPQLSSERYASGSSSSSERYASGSPSSSERYSSGYSQLPRESMNKSNIIGGSYQETVPIRILVSAGGGSSSPSTTISVQPGESISRHITVESGSGQAKTTLFKPSKDECFQVLSHDSSSGDGVCGSDSGIGGLADSGVWIKNYGGSFEMLDSVDGVSGVSDSGVFSFGSTADQESSSLPATRPARKPSYLSAVNAPVQRIMSASDSALMFGHLEVPLDSLDSAESIYAGGMDVNVTVRKKLQESLEEQATKLHRRTSYLMATARDRANMMPLEQTFSPPQAASDPRSQSSAFIRHQSSVKLNKFFGEMVPSISEGVEMKSTDLEEPDEIIRKGSLSCKISVIEGKKCSDRSWKPVYAILRPTELFLTRDKESGSGSNFEDQHIPLKLCMVEFARDYAKKKKNVFRMSTHNECEYLFQAEDRGTLMCWIQGIKSINEPMKADKSEEITASEKEKQMAVPIEINIIPSSKMSPQMGHKSKKLSALSFKSKLASSPNMKRKKSNATEKEESLRKGWIDRLPMMKSLKKHNDDSSALSLAELNVDTDKFQFGVPLEDCFPSPHNEYVPLIVELCTRIVEARGLEIVGVYRVPGNSAAVNALTEEFNRGIDNVNIDNEKLLDINVISSLLKSFFRKLPEPLIPSDSYDAFIEANRCPDEDKRKLKIKRLLHLLPPHHNENFKHMAEHLNKVASYGNINKMDAKNLAIMFGPTLVRKKGDDTVSLVTDMSDQCRIVESIILHHDWFFSTWDQDNYIPMETTVETVPLDDGQGISRDDDEEADSAISTKEIISSIVGAASKKLRQQQQQKSLESLDMVDNSSIVSAPIFRDCSSNDSVYSTSMTKSLASLTSSMNTSEDFQVRKSSMPSTRYLEMLKSGTKADLDYKELEFADASSPVSSNFSRHFSDECLVDRSDELEISHGLPTSVSRDAINRLKRIGDDVSALLHTLEQKQLKEREHRRREKEMVEREHLQTQLELEQEENHSVEDWLAWRGGNLASTKMPDLVSSSYVGETFPYEQNLSASSQGTEKKDKHDKKKVRPGIRDINDSSGHTMMYPANVPKHTARIMPTHSLSVHQFKMPRGGSHENIISHYKSQQQDEGRSHLQHPCERKMQESQQKAAYLPASGVKQRQSSFRNSLGRRHGSLDSLIELIDRKEKRSSWASTDSEDGSDLLTSITATFDQKLQILLNPKYKLTGSARKSFKNEVSGSTQDDIIRVDASKLQPRPLAATNTKQAYSVAALLDSVGSFRDPSLHRSARSDPKIGIASRFERSDISRASPSSAAAVNLSATKDLLQQRKIHLPDFKTFVNKPASQSKDFNSVVLTKPKKLQSNIVKPNPLNTVCEPKTVSKSGKLENNWNISNTKKEEKLLGNSSCPAQDRTKEENIETKKLGRRHSYRRHTVSGIEDLVHMNALSQVISSDAGRFKQSAWEQLQPAVTDPGTPSSRSMQAWIQWQRLRGSTPDLSCLQKQL